MSEIINVFKEVMPDRDTIALGLQHLMKMVM